MTMSADNSSDHKKLELFSNEENEDMEDEPANLSHSVRHCAGKRDCHLVVSETNDSGGDEGESSIHSSYTQLSPSLSVRVTPLSRKSDKGKYTSSTSSRKGNRDVRIQAWQRKQHAQLQKGPTTRPQTESINSVPERRIIISDMNKAV